MQKFSILFSLLGSFALAAFEPTIIPNLKGVLLVDASSKIRHVNLEEINGIQFDGIERERLEEELSSFLSGFPLTAGGAKELCDAIAAHYRETDGLRVAVTMPDQDLSEGVVQLVVTPELLGTLNVKESQYTEPETLTRWVRLSAADPINEKTLAQDVAWMNANPFHSVKVAYQPTAVPGITDVDLIVSDKKSWKISTGVDNTGTDPVGPIRIFAGLNINDFIFTDHTLSLKATTADHYNEYQSYKAEYVAALPWRNTLRLSGSYTGTDPDRTVYPQKHRQTYEANGRYVIPYWFSSNLWIDQVSFEMGADFKGTNTNILDQERATPVKKMLAYIGQFAGAINVQRNRDWNKISAGLDLVGSPASMLPNQTVADFNNLRQGATPQYFYSRLNLSVDQKLPQNWKVLVQGRGQFSLSNLVPSEQYALGGYNTVRGYAEKTVNGDHAICGNLELRTPEFSPVGLFAPRFGDKLALLGFVDAGYAWFREKVEDTPVEQGLMGAGPGLRYSVADYFTSRLDVGFPLLDVAGAGGKPHFHFNAILSY